LNWSSTNNFGLYLFKNKGRAYIQKAAVYKSLGLILSFLK